MLRHFEIAPLAVLRVNEREQPDLRHGAMRHFISFVSLMLLTACASTVLTHPFASDKPLVFARGTYTRGANVTLPRPLHSRFFSVEDAGFVVLKDKGAAYYLRASLSEHRTTTFFIHVEYENPREESHPFTSDFELKPKDEEVLLSSPEVVWGIQNYHTYNIRVSVFADREGRKTIDSLVQPLRACVDTTTRAVRIDNDAVIAR